MQDNYESLWFSKVLQFCAMPLEQNGLVVEYHDILKGLPPIKDRIDVLGVVIKELNFVNKQQSEDYLDWVLELLDAGKKIAFMGSIPSEDLKSSRPYLKKISQFWDQLGLMNNGWENQSARIQFPLKDPILINFERDYIDIKPGYLIIQPTTRQVTPHLIARESNNPKSDSYLIFTGPKASFVAEGYGIYNPFIENIENRKWYINPFLFFKLAFDTKELPKPDTTTLAGRRIYYSHIDGDGWNSISLIDEYQKQRAITADVILKEVIAPNPSLPVTVGTVVADLNPAWAGIPQAITTAKAIYKLEHVDMGSHTYSHPFDWHFFEHYNPKSEESFFEDYKFGVWTDNHPSKKKETNQKKDQVLESEFSYPKEISRGYQIPRAYANEPFNLNLEIQGSLDFINKLAPNKEKKAQLFQWSGDCLPFEAALKAVRLAGAVNINGGDTRFDNEYNSYSWVRPRGMNVGKELQIFSSMANENLYTDLWSRNFYGFNKLPNTIKNTNTPVRTNPINLYYHTYSGEKLASLLALQQNIEFIKSQEIIPITTTDYVRIVHGFYSAQIIPKGSNIWQIAQRGALQTIRFDNATFRGINFSKSHGVIGQRHFQGSLYAYLDQQVENPLIAVKDIEEAYREPIEETPYLIDSCWTVENLKKEGNKRWSFHSHGYGDGEMQWNVPVNGVYKIQWGNESLTTKSQEHLLKYTISEKAIEPLTITIELINQ